MASSPISDLPSMPSPSPNDNPNPEPNPSLSPEPSPAGRRQRLPRACTSRPNKRAAPPPSPPPRQRREKAEEPGSSGRVITPLLPDPNPDDLPTWQLRAMWQLASVLNFLHIFRSLLNIVEEFTAEELESALISPNSILDVVHMPLLKSIPPVTRMAMGPGTWVTVLCRKLKDWWHWVAEGEIPIVADHGAEIEAYKALEPATRLIILKAICDIRVAQEDIKNYIDHSLKQGIQLSLFRKERIGGDSYGVSYWYEDDAVMGHRLYREIRKVEAAKSEDKKKTEPKKLKRKGRSQPPPEPPVVTYQWETVATNLDEFQIVSDKLFESKNRTEVSLAKKLKIDYLPEIEKIHKMNIAIMQKKERLMKKQQREALLLNSYLHTNNVSATGRAMRNRKTVTYTFDDYDRSINEAIKLTKKGQESSEQPGTGTSTSTRRVMPRHDPSANGKSNSNSNLNGPTVSPDEFLEPESPKSEDYYEDINRDAEGEQDEPPDRSNRRRKKPRRYADDFVGPAYGAESDDDIIGEAVYDDSYLENKKHKSSSEGEEDEEYKLESDDNQEEDYEEEEEEDYSISSSDEEDFNGNNKRRNSRNNNGSNKYRSLSKRSSRRSGGSRNDNKKGLRRSRRAARPKINYRKYEVSESGTDSEKDADVAYSSEEEEEEDNGLEISSPSKNEEIEEDGNEYSNNNNDDGNDDNNGEKEDNGEKEEEKEEENVEKREERESPEPRRFLDLNELAPDGPDLSEKDEDLDDNS